LDPFRDSLVQILEHSDSARRQRTVKCQEDRRPLILIYCKIPFFLYDSTLSSDAENVNEVSGRVPSVERLDSGSLMHVLQPQEGFGAGRGIRTPEAQRATGSLDAHLCGLKACACRPASFGR